MSVSRQDLRELALDWAIKSLQAGDHERAMWYARMADTQRFIIEGELRSERLTRERIQRKEFAGRPQGVVHVTSRHGKKRKGSLLNPYDPYAQAGPTGGRSER